MPLPILMYTVEVPNASLLNLNVSTLTLVTKGCRIIIYCIHVSTYYTILTSFATGTGTS